MPRNLPARPSFTSLQKQAKQLLKDYRRGAPDAVECVNRHYTRPSAFTSLRDAQLVLARDYGFTSWLELKKATQDAMRAADDLGEKAKQFLDLACLTYGADSPRRIQRATGILDRFPAISTLDIYTAAVSGDVAAVRGFLSADSSLVLRKGGPRDWDPLMYVCYGRVDDDAPRRDTLAVARLLIEHGADPNAYYMWGNTYRFTALTGAIGEGEQGVRNQPPHQHAHELARLLLDAGADANDAQGLYNSMLTPGNEWIELLLQYGLKPSDLINWKTKTPIPTMDFVLGHAVRIGLPDRVEMLLAHGAAADSRNFYNGRTHYENAVLGGFTEIAESLVRHGAAVVELPLRERFRAACMASDASQARSIVADHPEFAEDPSLLRDAAAHGRVGAVRLLLELGVDPDDMRDSGSTALHQAAWRNRVDITTLLVERGANLLRDRTHGATPLGWAAHAGSGDVFEYLLQRCTDIFDLIEHGSAESIERLLASDPTGATLTDRNRNTPAHYLRDDVPDLLAKLDLLERHGADLNARDHLGRTPLDRAVASHADVLTDLLVQRGGRTSEGPGPTSR